MAVFTHLNREQVEKFLLESKLTDLKSFEGILQGVDNTNYKIETSGGRKYILTVFENRINPKDIPYFIGFMKHLSDGGITCPFPVHLGKIDTKHAAIFSFLDGRDVKQDDITPALCNELGILLARMHLLGESFQMTRDNSMAIDAWEFRLNRVGDAVYDYLDELQFLKTHWPKDLPKGSVHEDLFPDNVFIKDGHIYGVIDFYFSATDFLAYDLAIVMNAWCFHSNNQLDDDKWNALISGYQSIRPLTGEEKDAYHILSRGAAMRFLSSRLHDLTFHDPQNLVTPKPPAEYIQKLEFLKHAKLF
ncbi:MAG: homoserine kinase [Alphaproteobacteria bacterium RIFCSPHIGHO2_12_FULL_45_9]|nr:MAG: homoserine kinase [Alphaproteobacteria bacterium RIFCSPHIGHO2_02_FULL_46_13]OFW98977.1 MAG: homoserine kinase [Alphaproteobacteria bacterium RIFCSPHIGHO2_12_FULL_45_9]